MITPMALLLQTDTGVMHKEMIPWMGSVIIFLLAIIGFFVKYHFGDNKTTLTAILNWQKLHTEEMGKQNEQINRQFNRLAMTTQANLGVLNGRLMVVENQLSIPNRHKEAQLIQLIDATEDR